MAFLIGGANSAADTGYDIENSIRFNSGDSPDLRITPSSTGNRRTFTFSCWVKKCSIGGRLTLFSVGNADSDTDYFHFDTGDRLVVVLRSSSTTSTEVASNAFFRDPSAWYHMVMRVDSTQGTDSNRVRIYANGSQITSLQASTYPSQNTDFETNDTKLTTVGARSRSSVEHFHDGYMADVYFIDGTSLGPDSFGETDSDSGIWKPKKASVTYGTNGFFLEFKGTGTSQNSSGIGADTSGNDNHFAVTNLAATDQTTDTPTNNFATLNPLIPPYAAGTVYELSEGNCQYNQKLNQPPGVGNIAMTNGKWYWEVKLGAVEDNPAFGIVGANFGGVQGADNYGDADSTVQQAAKTREGGDRVGYSENGNAVYKNGSDISYGSWTAISANDIFMIALDMDNLKIWIGQNGTWLGSGDPAGESNEVTTLTSGSSQIAALDGPAGENVVWEINFGNPSFSISSGNADANGYGNFEYAVPSGFYALCTKNLAEFG